MSVFYTIAISPAAEEPRMKHVALFSAIIAVIACRAAAPALAQELNRNAYGVYIGPTIYGIARGSDYEFATTGAGLDVGLYYSRAFTESFSTRLEVKYGVRNLDDVELSPPFGYVP